MKDGTSEKILRAASGLFANRGVPGTSLGDIAKEVGISKGTLYYYFPTKQDVVSAVSESCLSAIGDKLFAWVDSVSADIGAETCLDGLCDALLGERELLRVFIALNNVVEPESELEAALDHAMSEWNIMIEVGSLRMEQDAAVKMKRMTAAILPFLCGLAALNADSDYAKQAFSALVLGQ
ncbi:MAG: TetR/AcrR family transcriptional regulator [Clostridiales bacterium]|nr:TetR/AcrR family transcriptional regulator [Clostridiales bacterium]